MLSRLLYYIVLKPLSFLPLGALYGFSDFLNLVLYKAFKYRQKVVRDNLINSFPGKSTAEIEEIERKFYHHFCDLIVESIKLFSISEKELKKRATVLNPDVLNALFDQGKSTIISAGHYNNWEMGSAILSRFIKHHVVGIYAPMSNPFFNDKFLKSRGRFGLEMLNKNAVKEGFEKNKHLQTTTLFATDQSPTHSKIVHWTTFLNQPTAVLLGSERFAREYDFPVIYSYISKPKRGYYEIELKVMEPNPVSTKVGEITENHTRWLEKQIEAAPEFWLWTHKRWKRKMKEGDVLYKAGSDTI